MTERKPKIADKELDKLEKQFDEFKDKCDSLTLDRMSEAPEKEVEAQTKLSSNQIDKSKDIWLKPKRTISCRDKFNEKFKEKHEFEKEYVLFIAENKEVIGENIEIWTRPRGGMSAEYWEVPVNRPVWGPRYLAEQIRRKKYHRLRMEEGQMRANDGMGTYYGNLVVDSTVARLTAEPVSTHKSVFMGATRQAA